MLARTQALLAALDGLGHDARIGRAIAEVRALPAGLPRAALLDDLAVGPTWLRVLAVLGAQAVRDVPRLVRALADPSLEVRRLAARLAGAYAPAPTLIEALADADRFTRRALITGVATAHRRDVAPAVAEALFALGLEALAARLLPLCPDADVARWLGAVEPNAVPWRRLGQTHPVQTLAALADALAGPRARRPRAWAQRAAALRSLALTHPWALLERVEVACADEPLPWPVQAVLGRLGREPGGADRVAALLTAPARAPWLRASGVPASFLPRLRALSPAPLLALATGLAEHPVGLAALLRRLPPRDRGPLFRAALPAPGARVWPDALMEALPHAVRAEEARRQLALKAVADDDAARLAMTAWLPIEEARPTLDAAARGSQAEDRAAALALLVRCTGRSRRGLGETLTSLRRLRNEQDPVRLAALSALAQVPAATLADDHVEGLDLLVTAVVEARDTSYGTRRAVLDLARRCLLARATAPLSPLFRFGLRALDRLAAQAGVIELPRFDAGLPRGAELGIVATLLPLLEASSAREYPGNVLRLATALGKRAWRVEALWPLVEEAIWARKSALGSLATALWLADPATRDARVRALLARDRTAIVLPRVFEHLHRHRQELLDPYLQGEAMAGAFLTKRSVYVIPAHTGFHRWLPRQQVAFARLLQRTFDAPKASAWEKASTIKRLALLPVTTVADLGPFLASSEVVVVEAALGALVHLDAPAPGLPILLDHLDGDRARVAMYALPRLAGLVPAPVMVAELVALLARPRLKITVHKEVLRLLGTLRTPAAVAALLAQWQQPTLHRDVRIAGLHAARGLLDVEAAWSLLAQALADPDPDVPRALLAPAPATLPARHRDRYLAALLTLAAHPEGRVREALFARLLDPLWRAGREAAVAPAAAACLAHLGSEAGWRGAARVLALSAEQAPGREALLDALGRLVEHAAAADPEPAADLDQPARRRLAVLTDLLVEVPLRRRSALAAAAERLAGLPGAEAEVARLRVSAFEPGEVAAATARLTGWLAPVSPGQRSILAAAVAALARSESGWEVADLYALIDGLAAASGLAALPLLAALGQRLEGPAEARTRLGALRRSADPDVAAAALATRW
ncbi:MAG: hypothetical protein H6706_04875 [Myxococcales bacterium]|nr:hypothetical protein [Myxococcales bacterium]